MKTETVNAGSSATPPSNPTRSGYTFIGWLGQYQNVNCDQKVYAIWDKPVTRIYQNGSWNEYIAGGQ